MDNSNIDNEKNSEITPEVNETNTPSDSSESLNNNEEIPQLGNGYNPARTNREAFQRGLDDNYNERIARNKANLDKARARSNQATKTNKNGEEQEKNLLDKAKDKANLLQANKSLLSSKIDNARAKAFQALHPLEAAKMIARKKMKAFLTSKLPIVLPYLLIFSLILFVVLAVAANDFGDSDNISANQGDNYTYLIDGEEINNIKVRLLRCEGYEAIPNEELVDFETYIIGVVSQENGNAPYEALKAQAVAARSYALTRAKEMGGAYGLSLKNENGQWILQIRNCTNDQAFCNPYKGCWSKVIGGQTGRNIPDEDCTIYTGTTTNENYWNGPILSEDSIIIKAVEETQGEVLVDNAGNIVYTPYVASTQEKWNSLANKGKDYFEILVDTYGSGLRLETPTYNPPETGEEEGNGIATGNYINPCPNYVRLTSPFGYRKHPITGKTSFHKGIDLGAVKGSEVLAFDGGKVTGIKTNCVEGDGGCADGAGNYVKIDHGNGMITRYYHLSKVLVNEGQSVTIGQKIAEVGNTGSSTGPHLHFGVQVDGEYVNPENYYTFDKK